MRKSIIMLSTFLLLTSCFSYKELELHQFEFRTGDIYKITATEKGFKKGKFETMNDSLIVLQGRGGQFYEIPRGEIQKIKRRKFSLGKTIAWPTAITLVVAGAAIVSISDWGGPAIDLIYYY